VAPRKLLGQIMKELDLLTEGDVQEALQIQRREGGMIGEILVRTGAVEPAGLARALAAQAGLEFRTLGEPQLPEELLGQVDSSTARVFKVLPLARKGQVLEVGIADPANLSVTDDLSFSTGLKIKAVVVEGAELDRLLDRFYPDDQGGGRERDVARLVEDFKADGLELDVSDPNAAAQAGPVVKLLNYILLQAIRDKASDIHLEPFEEDFKIRYRVDGVLYEMEAPPPHLAVALISRVKVLSNLDIAETRFPQDGRIQVSVGGRAVDLRVSTLPTMFGESCVLRILDRSVVSLDLENLGLRRQELEELRRLNALPHGIILVTGPTGSGKTTTLYAALKEANDETVKTITTEDPVEYDLDGVIQVPVNEEIGVTYARVLRTILRQDPDKILVGEIRDLETARTAVEASLTGHVVFSTLHTNDAPSAIMRLVDMGVEPYLITATLQAIVAQRLVRKICPHCKAAFRPGKEVLTELELTEEEVAGREFHYGKGCDRCNHTGYLGRMGLFEIMTVSEPLREQILELAPLERLRRTAREQGMRTLRESGLAAIFDGWTTVEEVVRETFVAG